MHLGLEQTAKGRREGPHIVESDECFNKGSSVALLEKNGESLCHCGIDNDESCVCARVGFIKSAFCGLDATILDDKVAAWVTKDKGVRGHVVVSPCPFVWLRRYNYRLVVWHKPIF
ncbi:hypothetical protein NPIL_221261 [Nephila pilipes]|uniref:Uncharacterized protein n=1 Tax=Nephila pilipes TaxID=299642 RepID=A0A8X6QUI0_NEPPI|nr:hypothetical protein NPIL_221261 [Nephila pilipes]